MGSLGWWFTKVALKLCLAPWMSCFMKRTATRIITERATVRQLDPEPESEVEAEEYPCQADQAVLEIDGRTKALEMQIN